jgi:choice-of-anchor B domain-containing protein
MRGGRTHAGADVVNGRNANQFRHIKYAATLVTLVSCAVSAPAQEVELVAQFDPMPGTDYADVWGEGNYAYLATQGNGVFIVDISNPASPQLASHYLPGQNFQDVKVANGIGYFASQGALGVHVVDLSDPTAPALLKHLTSADGGYDWIHNVSVFGNYLYEATCCGSADIKVFDISTPSTPQFVRDIRIGGLHDITALGDRLYVSAWNSSDGGTHIFDVSEMSTTQEPTLLGTILSGSSSHSNWVTDDGNVLVTARECGNNCGVTLWDISDPSDAILLKRIRGNLFGAPGSVAHNPLISGDFLYVSWYETGIQVFDISDPVNPIHVGGYDTCQGCGAGTVGNWGVYPFLGEDRVLLSDRTNGLFIVDVSAVVPEPATGMICCLCLAELVMSRDAGRNKPI